jgi:hypothetical protein
MIFSCGDTDPKSGDTDPVSAVRARRKGTLSPILKLAKSIRIVKQAAISHDPHRLAPTFAVLHCDTAT